MRVLELPDRLRAYGVEVVEVDGWRGRGKEFPGRPDGALRHWTVGGMAPTSSLRVVTHGRSDLPGPLCHVLQSRGPGRDKAYVVASGIANHAGKGLWNGISGNSKLLGLEIEWQGPNEHFPASRIDVSERIMRALLDCCTGTNTNDVAEHREYATPKGRKIDTNLDGNVLRRRMIELRQNPNPQPEPQPQPEPEPEEEDMLALITCIPSRLKELPPQMQDAISKGAWLFTDGDRFWWCPTVGHAESAHFLGLVKSNRPVEVSPSFIKELRPRTRADMDPGEALLPIMDGSAKHFFFDHTGKVHQNAYD